MEKAQCLMWMRRREMLRSKLQASLLNNQKSTLTWEERAFEEDIHGCRYFNGGCVWPPRSYLCSFCKREFRSAQALGGHMNVHRRDRARLKHSLTILDQNDDHGFSTHVLNHESLESPNSVCTTSVNTNPSSSPRVSSSLLATRENSSKLPEVSQASSNLNHGDHYSVETDCFLGIGSQNYSRKANASCCYSNEVPCCKKAKTNSSNLSCSFMEVIAGSKEEIDLELRLGVK